MYNRHAVPNPNGIPETYIRMRACARLKPRAFEDTAPTETGSRMWPRYPGRGTYVGQWSGRAGGRSVGRSIGRRHDPR